MKKITIIASTMLILTIIWQIFSTGSFQSKINKDAKLYENIKVTIYVKSTCFYCQQAVALLNKDQVEYEVIELTNNRALQLQLIEQTGRTTVPYVFINDEFIGGFDELNNVSWKEMNAQANSKRLK